MTYGEKISVGSILDERYEIKKIIKANEKITIYEGWHQQIEESFLIQEMSKSTDYTDKILSRARRLSDFSEFTNLFQVCDQFSAGEKSYVIMEYPRGQCLEKVLSSEKKLSEKVLDHMFHSLMKTLEKLEEAGMKDLPVEADTLYLQEDGSLYLFPETDRVIPGYTDYAYQICELMYQGLTGQKPPDKAIRLLFDEMTPLKEANLSCDADFCKIIDEGLKINGEEEPQKDSLGDLSKNLEQWREKENKKTKKKRYWIAGGILSAILICTVLFGLYLKFEEKIRFWGIKTETILLEPGEDVNRKEYQKSLEILEKRVKDLVGTNKYLIKDDDGVIRIIMPEKACKKIDNEALLKEYLSRPMKLTVAVGNGSVKWFALASEQYVTLENKDILKVEEVDTEDSESWSTGETVNKMLKVTVSDEAAEQLKKKLGSLQEQINKETDDTEEKYYPLVCLDGEETDYDSHIEVSGEQDDWHTIGILENSYFEMAKNLWKEETFDTAFQMTSQIGEINWEKKTTSVLKKWVDGSEISDPSVILEYDRTELTGSKTKADKGDYYHNIGDLAQRLESLGISYALGNIEGDYDRLAVKLRQKDMSDMVADILGRQEQISIQNVWGYSLFASDIQLSTEHADGDNRNWKVSLECSEEDMKDFAESVMKSNGYVYLYGPLKYCVGKVALTEMPTAEKTDLDSVEPDRKKYQFFFQETNLGETGYFTKGMDSLAKLFANMSDRYNLNDDFKLVKVQYNEKGKQVFQRSECRTAWEQNNKEFKKIQKTAEHKDSYVELKEEKDSYYKGERDLYIILHMDTQENYVDSAVDRIVNLWNTCKLEESDYSLIRFCVSEYQEYPIVNIRRSFADDKWTLSVRWSDETYGEKLKERIYQELKNKTFLKNGQTEENSINNLQASLEETDEAYEKMKQNQYN